jgi:hypothetical protein
MKASKSRGITYIEFYKQITKINKQQNKSMVCSPRISRERNNVSDVLNASGEEKHVGQGTIHMAQEATPSLLFCK